MKKLRSSSLFEKIEVVFHFWKNIGRLRRPRLVWLWLRAWQRLLSLLFRVGLGWVGGWLEELELKQALKVCFGLELSKIRIMWSLQIIVVLFMQTKISSLKTTQATDKWCTKLQQLTLKYSHYIYTKEWKTYLCIVRLFDNVLQRLNYLVICLELLELLLWYFNGIEWFNKSVWQHF